MTHIAGFGRDQLLLLPEAVDDYVEADNSARFIDAFVDGLDLAGAGFARVEAKATGRPGYAPGDLLKLYIYGYLNRVRSSRRLEREAQRNIEVIWLLRGLKPDFKTIADFRRDSRGAFKSVFRQFVLLCRRLDLYGRELLAVDGTRIKAVNNQDRNFTRSSLRAFIRAADERLEDYLKRLDEGDVADGATSGGARTKNLAEKIAALSEKRGRYQAMLAQLERTGEDQISLTDPDSRAMAAHTKVSVGYNIQVAVDAKNKLIVEQAVTNQVVDMGLLTETAEPARQVLGVETIDVVADRGYFKIEDIEACEKVGCIPHVPRPQRGSSVREGFFRKDEFRYDARRDAYVCPAGKVLTPIRHGRLRDLAKVYGYSDNYLIDLKHAVIMDVEATTAIRQAEVGAAKTMLDRTAEQFDLAPSRLVADGGYGSAEMVGWLVDERGIEPHVKLMDKAERTDGTFSRSDFAFDPERNLYVCPGGKELRKYHRALSKPRDGVTKEGTMIYFARKHDCEACALKPQCCPNAPARKIARSVHEAARDKARAIAKTEAYVVSRRERKKVEMLFAHLKRILRLDRLRLRGPSGAKDEFLLAATAQNLRKLAKLIPLPAPIFAT